MDPSSTHPIERFEAPSAITAGQPLKDLFNPALVALIGESFAAVQPAFDPQRFERRACTGLESGAMKARAAHIGRALAQELPEDFAEGCDVLVAALGPPEPATEGNGLRGFFYMPHSAYLERHGSEHFEAAMAAMYELTQRFTSEFSIRPLIVSHQTRTLELLKQWTEDSNPHVRRLCSEGTRPRLPWASRLPALQSDPSLALPLLEALKDDGCLYVRRSVANHLGDVCKDDAERVYTLCHRWLDEVDDASAEKRKQRCWMIRHAVRLPAKKGDEAALALRERAKA